VLAEYPRLPLSDWGKAIVVVSLQVGGLPVADERERSAGGIRGPTHRGSENSQFTARNGRTSKLIWIVDPTWMRGDELERLQLEFREVEH
jgi:hypothetical protein